ncbi:heterokaryon incompatibility 6 OR allele [Fusarium tjaetaba]|uniref:Heterokaryon incompatibility 6 OR allele n=1 Tax=Fusarium tjaetaba TaxID=1567544 RepID=A0A8H5S9D2_9HYPO|nr:heterokaryon incompatibility 6 OR allele [Fusarium tjaetaba]KAF5646958.1 heterokaryon incompatibility 6 OR allele [Fusarium tjaetaba]
MVTGNFKYNSLQENEIRVLVLDAAAQERDTLSGALVVVKHMPGDHVTRYDAMSYIWGDQSDPDYVDLRHPRPIGHDISYTCDKESLGTLAIGRNLASALRKIRHQSNNQILWADSICINQKDLDERAAQVLRMREIYKHAQRVIAWLGPADKHRPIAIAILEELANCVNFINKENDILDNRITFKPDKYDFIMRRYPDNSHDWSKPMPFSDHQRKALISLISRSWFRRLWVRQGILLASKDTIILVGDDSMPWLHFRSAIEMITSKREALAGTVDIHTMVEFSNARSFSPLRHLKGFFSLVAYTHACERVASPAKMWLIGEKDVKDVHRDALVRASTYHQDLKLMSLSGRPITYGRAALCSAENGHAFTKEQLLLQGIRCEYITELVGPQDSQNSQAELQATVLDAARRYLGPEPETWDFQKVQQFFLMLHMQEQLAEQISAHSKTLGGQLAHLTYYMHNRSIYLTKMGYIVLGPRGCQPDDPVVIFLGCHLPMVLRSIEDDEFKLRGPCVHPSLLGGEAILGELPNGWRLSYPKRGEKPILEDPDGKRHHIDPRLNGIPISEGWELRWRDNGTPFWYIATEDRWTNFDPRVSLEGLRKRGRKVDDYVPR